jgi:uncharacterized protein YndB with AHSA1/START domain
METILPPKHRYIKGPITRIYRELKINELIKKWITELNRTFSKKEIQMAKKHMKNAMSSHKRNENQNHTKVPPHPC